MATNPQQTNNQVISEAEKLLLDIKQANKRFANRTKSLIKDISHGIRKAEDELQGAERDLEKLEQQSVAEMDAAVLNFLSEE